MSQKVIPVTPGQFRSFPVIATAVVCTLSALLGIVGVVLLFDPKYAAILVQSRIAGGIQLRSALQIWYWIDSSITILSFLCPAVMAAGLWMVLCRRYAGGMKLISHLFQGLLWAVYGSGALTLAVFVFKMVRSIAFYLTLNEGVYHVYSLLITEGLMGVQAWLIFLVLRKFLREGADCAFSIAYTLTSRKLDTLSIPSFTATGFLILGLAELSLCPGRVVTVSLVENYVQNYYQYIIAAHPGQYFAAATLFTGAVGNFLAAISLHRYNRTCERMRFQANRLT